MTETANVRTWKMNGVGNDIIVADLRAVSRVLTPQEAAAFVSETGDRCDQLMVLHKPLSDGTETFIRIYNGDGSPAGACGNGMRCVTRVLADETGRDRFLCETVAGVLICTYRSPDDITIDMGAPRLRWDQIPLRDEFHNTTRVELQIGPIDDPVLHSPSVANMGNPHAIFWVDDVDAQALDRFGPMLETHPLFPEGANISVAAHMGGDELRIRTWERGAGLTKACGSAACAAAVNAHRTRRTSRNVTVHMPGGTLLIEWRESDDHVLMTGPAEYEHEGLVALPPVQSKTAAGAP